MVNVYVNIYASWTCYVIDCKDKGLTSENTFFVNCDDFCKVMKH